MVAFTRILHRQTPDVLMDEVIPVNLAAFPGQARHAAGGNQRHGALHSKHTAAAVQLHAYYLVSLGL